MNDAISSQDQSLAVSCEQAEAVDREKPEDKMSNTNRPLTSDSPEGEKTLMHETDQESEGK